MDVVHLNDKLRWSSTSLTTKCHKACVNLGYNLYTLWLFTFSDLKTILGPSTMFGVFNALCANMFGIPSVPAASVVCRTLHAVVWIWCNLLPFSIDNQRQPLSEAEDSINKSWRPMPAKRLTEKTAKRWMLGLYPVAIVISIHVGGLRQCLLLIALGCWYNDLGGADRSPLIRNFINACGFLCYASGAMEVVYGHSLPLEGKSLLSQWFSIIGGAVVTSVHSQDMEDKEGDRVRGRKTVPLVIGDWPSRLTLALAVTAWSCLGLHYWRLESIACMPTLVLGTLVALRTLMLRGVGDDKRTFRLWNLWLTTLYLLPAFGFYSEGTMVTVQ